MGEDAPGDGNHVNISGSMAGQSLSIKGQGIIIITIILLVGLFVVGFMVWRNFEKKFDLLHSHHIRLAEAIAMNNLTLQRMILTLDHNISNPEHHIPLELTPPAPLEPSPQPRRP